MNEELQSQYDALYQEYQDVMYKGAWRLGWSFFFVLVGLLPMMYIFIWLAGPRTWENTLFHAPKIMWIAAPLNLGIVVLMLSASIRGIWSWTPPSATILSDCGFSKPSCHSDPRHHQTQRPRGIGIHSRMMGGLSRERSINPHRKS